MDVVAVVAPITSAIIASGITLISSFLITRQSRMRKVTDIYLNKLTLLEKEDDYKNAFIINMLFFESALKKRLEETSATDLSKSLRILCKKALEKDILTSAQLKQISSLIRKRNELLHSPESATDNSILISDYESLKNITEKIAVGT
jgi:hypothetical protein